jgi:RNA:NAD 2'-phosphotransferase (TPT1/KptA family)
MLLRHATLARNLPSILRRGLLSSKSKGKIKAVWLHSPAASTWAALHTIRRHGGRIEDVVIIELEVPRRTLRRSRKRLWYATGNIPPACFRRLISFQELAGRPGDDSRSLAAVRC